MTVVLAEARASEVPVVLMADTLSARVLLLRRHAREPHELPEAERVAFFEDMVRVGRALELVYGALKLNYSILGNVVPHLHAHIQPRFHGDPYPGGTVNPAPGQALALAADQAREQILRIRAALA